MGVTNSISSIRLQNCIDVYFINFSGQLIHYYVNPQTNWEIRSQVLYDGAVGKVAATRYLNYIDIYFANTKNQLVHMWANAQFTNWQYWTETLLSGLYNLVSPVAFRFQGYIDVYCVSGNQSLIHLWANNQTNWQYWNQTIKNGGGQILALSGIRTTPQSMDIYFNQGGILWNSRAGTHNQWKHEFRQISDQSTNKNNIVTLRKDCNLDIFFCDSQNYIRQFSTGEWTNWDYRSGQRLGDYCRALDSKFCAIRFQDHIDLYFIGFDKQIHHTYSGCLSNWQWTNPQQISQIAAVPNFGLTVCRKQNAIDVFYISQNEEIQNLFIGQGTNNDWSRYWTKGRQTCPNSFINKNILKWEEINHECQRIGQQGYHGIAYYLERLNVVLKIMKRPDSNAIAKEVALLDKLAPLWPNLCQYQVMHNGRLVGFSVKHFKGIKWGQIMNDSNNLFKTNMKARVLLFSKIKNIMAQVQKLGVCHGDLSFGNVLIDVKSKERCQFDVFILDFGNGFCFSQNNFVSEVLTGWQFLKPYQSRNNRPYNPSGVNAFQVGRMALQILLARKFSSYSQIQVNHYCELEKLKKANLYSQELIRMVQNLCHPSDLNVRNKSLFENPQNMFHIPSRELNLNSLRVRPQQRGRTIRLQNYDLLNQQIESINVTIPSFEDQDGGETIDWFIQSAILFAQISNPVMGWALDRVFAIFKIWTDSDPFEKMKQKIQNLINQKISQFASQKAKSTFRTISRLTSQVFSQLKNQRVSRSTRRMKFISLDQTIYASLSDMRIQGYEMLLMPEFLAVCLLHLKLLQFGMDHCEQFRWNSQEKSINIQNLKYKILEYQTHFLFSQRKHIQKFDNKLQELHVREQEQKRKMPTRVGFPGLQKVRQAIREVRKQKSQFQQNVVTKFQKIVYEGFQKILQF